MASAPIYDIKLNPPHQSPPKLQKYDMCVYTAVEKEYEVHFSGCKSVHFFDKGEYLGTHPNVNGWVDLLPGMKVVAEHGFVGTRDGPPTQPSSYMDGIQRSQTTSF
ncbi:hypothetical protein VTH82DRAFT_2342 [Thermothelomyces myriococcoides]